MAKRDYYEILGVTRTVTEVELKSAFRKAAMQCHPDRNPGDKAAESLFKEVNEAYQILSDGQKRAAYDRFGHAAFEQGGGGGGGFGMGEGFASSMADIFDDLFGDVMGRRGARGGGRERGSDLRYNLEITLEEAFSGKTAQLKVPTSVTCEACAGSGAKAGSKPKACATCGGHGRVRAAQGFFSIERTCPTCGGLGSEQTIDADLVVPDPKLTLRKGAIAPWARSTSPYYVQTLEALGKHYKFRLDTAFEALPKKAQDVILHGSGEEAIKFSYDDGLRAYDVKKPFEGVVTNLQRRYLETESEWAREEIGRYMSATPCKACKGFRLKPEALAVKIAGLNIGEVVRMSIREAHAWIATVPASLTPHDDRCAAIADRKASVAPGPSSRTKPSFIRPSFRCRQTTNRGRA